MDISLKPEPLFHLGAFPVTNTLVMAWMVILGLCVVTYFATRKVKLIPGKLQNFVEWVFHKWLNQAFYSGLADLK